MANGQQGAGNLTLADIEQFLRRRQGGGLGGFEGSGQGGGGVNGGGGEQFDLRRLLAQQQLPGGGGFTGFAGEPIATPIGVGGGPLPGAAGQTFAPNVPFSGGSVFKPDERAATIQNSLVLARNLSETLSKIRRQRAAAKAQKGGGDASRSGQ